MAWYPIKKTQEDEDAEKEFFEAIENLKLMTLCQLLDYENENWTDEDWTMFIGDELQRRADAVGMRRGEYIADAVMKGTFG